MALPPDIGRLVYDALAALGEDADAEAIARTVRRLDHGLPAEDEFSVVCAWLGKCELIHKLDQLQTPFASRRRFQVPDLLAKFVPAAPVLIEVKVCNDQTLSFKPDYHRRLTEYADMVGLPLLIAWKFHTVWILFEIRHAKLARTNFNVRYDVAMRNNLLGVLAGDVAFVASRGAGIHLTIAKEELVDCRSSDEETTETWRMRVSRIEFTTGGGQPAELHPESAQLLTTIDLESEQSHFEDSVRQSFIVGAETRTQFAHRALVGLLDWESPIDKPRSWRSLLAAPRIIRHIEDFQGALSRGLQEGVVTYIFHQQPAEMPAFLGQESRHDDA